MKLPIDMKQSHRYAALTIASKRYIALARVTAASFLEHNPKIPFYLLLADEDDGSLELENAPFNVIRLDSLALPEPDRFRFQYAELEFSYALTPFAIDYLLGQGFSGVLFLKQETLVLDELGTVLSGLKQASVLVTPHFLEPPKRTDALVWEVNVLRAGVFNGGLIAFANCDEAKIFLAWWKSKTSRSCLRDFPNGLHYEQRWLDFIPSWMPNYHVIRDSGVNVGHWNLPDREVKIVAGKVTAKGVACRVFRFSGYDTDVPNRVTKYNKHYFVSDTGEAAVVFARYQKMLMDAGHATARQGTYAYGNYDNGKAIEETHRRIYRQLEDRVRQFGNPFDTVTNSSFYQWLQMRAKSAKP